MSEHIVSRLRNVGSYSPADVSEAADRLQEMESALLNIMATFGHGYPSVGAYKARYFRCLAIARGQLKHLGMKMEYSNYAKYAEKRRAEEMEATGRSPFDY